MRHGCREHQFEFRGQRVELLLAGTDRIELVCSRAVTSRKAHHIVSEIHDAADLGEREPG
jgi:hypothetical protein